MRHFATAELQLHSHLVPLVEKRFAVTDLRQVIVLVDIYAELDLLQLGAGGLLFFFLLRDVVTEFPEVDNLADRRIRRGRDLHQIEPEGLRLTQRVRQFHDAELFARGGHDDPDFACANPAVNTNLWLQCRSSSEPTKREVNRVAVFLVSSPFSGAARAAPNTPHRRGCDGHDCESTP